MNDGCCMAARHMIYRQIYQAICAGDLLVCLDRSVSRVHVACPSPRTGTNSTQDDKHGMFLPMFVRGTSLHQRVEVQLPHAASMCRLRKVSVHNDASGGYHNMRIKKMYTLHADGQQSVEVASHNLINTKVSGGLATQSESLKDGKHNMAHGRILTPTLL